MVKFKKGSNVRFYSRVHKKEVPGVIEFIGSDQCITVVDGTRYSLQNTQLMKAKKNDTSKCK